GPAKDRKLRKTIGSDWLWLTSWPEVDTAAAETALREAMRSHWARERDAIQRARMQFAVDPAIDGTLNMAIDTKVKAIWFRGYLESSEEGRRALGTLATLFDDLLVDAGQTKSLRTQGIAAQRTPPQKAANQIRVPPRTTAPPRRVAERAPEVDAVPWRLRTLDESLALRTAKIRHPVSPAYSVLVAISQRIDSRRGQRLTHGEQLLVALFDELNAEWENGGLEQYLTNSSGAGGDRARAYLGEIGAWGTLAILDEAAWRFYGGSIPRNSAPRERRLEDVLTTDDDANRWLDAADRRWRTVQKELYERLADYAEDHAADFARPTRGKLAISASS
ncbi:MAG TPA: DUF4375 domain-containing protein, partial [Gemmatimonadaceae bacterium]|nr:DUF4375 domain-containing protein [Gemmatimonadaceae bacterium]